ncbi:MAG: YiaA/YiaB family inner membrane protein [Nocardioides sp.]|uniref:YiaA/YiaB family inner membrane protein n=1 Tax=Nocardioides sp. TaxID=35761 RepID=UPI003F12BC70
MDTKTPAQTRNTTAFFVQSAIAFAVALGGMLWAVLFLPIDPWVRGFLGMTTLFLVSSSFTLAKVVRDNQENQSVHSRIDQARLDKLLSEHDPFRPVV